MNTKGNTPGAATMGADAKPTLRIAGWEVIPENCPDRAAARALAEKRLCEIEQRVTELKREKTTLNRHKHLLGRLISKYAAAGSSTRT